MGKERRLPPAKKRAQKLGPYFRNSWPLRSVVAKSQKGPANLRPMYFLLAMALILAVDGRASNMENMRQFQDMRNKFAREGGQSKIMRTELIFL